MSDHPEPEVSDDVEHHRLVVEREKGAVAELIYQVDGDRLILVRAGVSDRSVGGASAACWCRRGERADRDGATVVRGARSPASGSRRTPRSPAPSTSTGRRHPPTDAR